MPNLETKHYAVLAAMLVSLGAQIAGLQHGWSEAGTPAFIGGLIGQIGTVITAIYVGAPRNAERRERASDPQPPKE